MFNLSAGMVTLCIQRAPKLLNQILRTAPDVINLQEIDLQYYTSFFLPQLRSCGFEGSFLPRKGKQEGLATLYRKSRFELLQRSHVELSVEKNALLGAAPQVGLITLLRAREGQGRGSDHGGRSVDGGRGSRGGRNEHPGSNAVGAGKVLQVVNTHLIFNPKRGDIKLMQLAMLLNRAAAELKAAGLAVGTAAVVLVGDFNAAPNSGVLSFASNGRLCPCRLDRRGVSGQLAMHAGPYPPPRTHTHYFHYYNAFFCCCVGKCFFFLFWIAKLPVTADGCSWASSLALPPLCVLRAASI